ncbi:MAG: helix-turn-helix transcriptional regulator [Desulfocapsa sp.]|nr:helix-turn-helix transcriptional regulator [Desulfocapsa sp.]
MPKQSSQSLFLLIGQKISCSTIKQRPLTLPFSSFSLPLELKTKKWHFKTCPRLLCAPVFCAYTFNLLDRIPTTHVTAKLKGVKIVDFDTIMDILFIKVKHNGQRGVNMTIADRIKQLRQERQWTQAELAEKIGIKQKQISAYERGVNSPSTDFLIKIAGALV